MKNTQIEIDMTEELIAHALSAYAADNFDSASLETFDAVLDETNDVHKAISAGCLNAIIVDILTKEVASAQVTNMEDE